MYVSPEAGFSVSSTCHHLTPGRALLPFHPCPGLPAGGSEDCPHLKPCFLLVPLGCSYCWSVSGSGDKLAVPPERAQVVHSGLVCPYPLLSAPSGNLSLHLSTWHPCLALGSVALLHARVPASVCLCHILLSCPPTPWEPAPALCTSSAPQARAPQGRRQGQRLSLLGCEGWGLGRHRCRGRVWT